MEHGADCERELQSLLTFLYMAPVGVVQTDMAGSITMINPMAANLLMPLQANGTLVNLFEAVEHSLPEIRKLTAAHAGASGMICKALRFSPFFRARRYAENKTYEITVLKVSPAVLMTVLTDVTETVLREEQIRLGSAWYNALLNEQFKYGVVGLDRDGRILNWNEAMEKVTGFAAADVVGKSCTELFEDGRSFASRLPDLLYDVTDSGWTLQNDWCVRSDGTRYWASYIISVPEMNVLHAHDTIAADARVSSYVLLLRDINQYADASEKMLHAATSDELTKLLNRRAFFDKAETEINRWRRSRRPLCLLLIDVDHFKSVNDRFGHDAGDSVLRELASAIRQCVRTVDITARVGGEEFAVLLPYTGIDDAMDLAERVRIHVASTPIGADLPELTLTISVGVAQMEDAIPDLRALMKAADGALYRAKHAGRNQVCKA